MAKIRVQDVAKELNVPVQEIMKKLEGLGIFVPNPMSSLQPAEYVQIKSLITGKKIQMVKKKVVKDAPATAAAQAEAPKAAAPKAAEPKKEAPKTAPVKTEEPKKEAPKTEATKAEPAKAPAKEAPKAEPVKEAPKAEDPKAEPVKEAPKAEAPKAELVKEAPKAEAPKAEQPKNDKPAGERRPQNNQNREGRPQRDGENRGGREGRPNRDGQGRDGERRYNNGEGRPQRDGERRYNNGEGRPQRDGERRYNNGEGRPQRDGERRYNNGEGRPQRDGERRFNNGEGRPQRDGERRFNNGEGRPARDGERRFNGEGRDGRNGEGRQDRGDRRFGGEGRGNDFRGNKDGGFKDKDADRDGQNRGQGGRRNDNRKSGSGYLDGGLAIPERPKIDDKPVKKRENIHKDKEKSQKNNGSDEYKKNKKNLMQEANFMDDDRLARHKKKGPKKPAERQAVVEEEISIVTLPESMTVKEFADMLHKPINQIIKALMGKGIMAGLNQVIEYEQAEELAMDMGILVEHQVEEDIFERYANPVDEEEDLQERPPVVVVMGHVDHGKTSLLDAIRNTKVTEGEAGGITQHIGASVVEIDGRKITFLDTPGHEAFTAMRLRGAMATDIAILVVAADDGVMPQTVEAINHAKAAGVQIIVAINKMDKPAANPDRVKQELTEHGLIAEEWGGTTPMVPVSAKKRQGIDDLLEMVLLVADLGELKANPDCLASGSVIESQLDKGRGSVATVLVQRGTLHVGDTIVAGSAFGRVKAMVDDRGRRVKEAGPSKPVEIIGLNEVPAAGENFYMTETEREARLLAEKVAARERAKLLEGNKKVNLNDLFGDIQAGNMKELNIVVKADVQGSVEAVRQSLEKLSNEEVTVKVIHGGVGAVNESDVMLASASNSIIIGFNVRPDATAKSAAEEQHVDLRLYRVIYNAIEDIEAAMKGMLDPEFEEKLLGHAEVRQVFKASGVGTIAGSYVLDGKIVRNATARLVRDGIVIHEGPLASLRRFKDDVKEVNTGYECGIMFEKYSDIKEGDVIEAFVMEEIVRS